MTSPDRNVKLDNTMIPAMTMRAMPIHEREPEAPEKNRSAGDSDSSSDLMKAQPAAYKTTPKPPRKAVATKKTLGIHSAMPKLFATPLATPASMRPSTGRRSSRERCLRADVPEADVCSVCSMSPITPESELAGYP